jgi:hypothetical protein
MRGRGGVLIPGNVHLSPAIYLHFYSVIVFSKINFALRKKVLFSGVSRALCECVEKNAFGLPRLRILKLATLASLGRGKAL